MATTRRLRFKPLDLSGRLCVYGAAVATVLAAFADLDWRFELFTPFRLHIAVAVAVLGVILLLLRRHGHAVLAAMILVVNAGAVVEHDELLAVHAGLEGGTGIPLRLVTFNVLDTNKNQPGIVKWLVETGADVVILIEAGPSAVELMAGLGDIYAFRHASTVDNGRSSTLIMSRYPLENDIVL